MRKHIKKFTLFALIMITAFVFFGCGKSNFLDKEENVLIAGEVDPEILDQKDEEQDIDTGSGNGLHPIFGGNLGVRISKSSMGAVDPDPTGHTACDDYDGDGIPNDQEGITNQYVADYPRIVTRIQAPITMKIMANTGIEKDSYSESLTESDVKNTVTNSMEDKHYTIANEKTTPYVTRDSLAEGGKDAEAYGFSSSATLNVNAGSGQNVTANAWNFGVESSVSLSGNKSFEEEYSRSKMSEKTVFEDVDYIDNLDKNGIEFTSDTVEKIVNNYRKSAKLKESTSIGPNAGLVRAALYLKNMTVNMPVHVSDVVCTLSFRTPGGKFLPIKTFSLKNDDYSDFSEDIYGGEELGPYTIEVANLNTDEIRVALANGYVPQIHVVSYDLHKVEDSNYNPGVNNLKIVEETAKARTATIKIVAPNMRELFRVAAFDVENADPSSQTGEISPGISLKKALFHIFADRIGDGEKWDGTDTNGYGLTVADSNLRWKSGALDKTQHVFSLAKKQEGNTWRKFETYVKESDNPDGSKHTIEIIKRIDSLSKYNPFNEDDNESYDTNTLLSTEELNKMKFWVIFSNGRYFEGDINDTIWAGERYEIVLMDMKDYKEHYENFIYTPFQSGERVNLTTRWNKLTEENGEFSRAIYLGKVLPNDVIQLEVSLLQSRFLFDENDSKNGFGTPELANISDSYYYNYNYTLEKEVSTGSGIPEDFTFTASGGINSIFVRINESKNALSYDITFTEEGTDGVSKTVNITKKELEKNSGVAILSSQSDPSISNIAGMSYTVTVEALGSYPVFGDTIKTIPTKGTSDDNIANVVEAEDNPKAFTFDANGVTGSIDVRISASEDAEYYTIRTEGPYNYASAPVPVNTVGYAGYNSIELQNPPFEDLEANNFVPGLYSVEVYAKNKNCLDESVGAYNGIVYVEVPYDKYAKQRRFTPKLSDTLFDLNIINLEVNFNDGNGWFPLQVVDPLKGESRGTSETAVIDCYYSSHMEMDNQKFFINFMPPHGQLNGVPNVFFGGKEEAKVYIRTIAKTKYRDTFWPVPFFDLEGSIINFSSYEDADNYVLYNFSSENIDITDYWLSDNTDATDIEDSVNHLSGYGRLLSPSVDDYFFSPKEERIYSIKASVSDEIQIVEGYRPNPPDYSTTPPFTINNTMPLDYGFDNILIEGISSPHASSYDIYYAEGIVSIDPESEKWYEDAQWIESIPLDIGDNSRRLTELAEATNYTICVAAKNKYGLGMPSCRQVAVPVIPDGEALIPSYGGLEIGAGAIVFTDVTAEIKQIPENIPATKFVAYWKFASESGDDVDSPPWQAVENTGSTISIPVSGDSFGTIEVRIYAFNNLDVRGKSFIEPEEDIQLLTQFIALEDASDVNVFKASGSFRYAGNNLIDDQAIFLQDGVQFNYGSPIDDIFDTGTSGLFSEGKYFRIVEGGRNVVSDLGLTPIAMNLSTNIPTGGYNVYVDPERGKFSLPRPIYWSRFSSWDNVENPEIQYVYGAVTVIGTGMKSHSTTKFADSSGTAYIESQGSTKNVYIDVIGENYLSKGTASWWAKMDDVGTDRETGGWIYVSGVRIGLWDNDPITQRLEVVDSSSTIIDSETGVDCVGKFVHVYVVWDSSGLIDGQYYFKVYVNGVLVSSIDSDIGSDWTSKIYFRMYANDTDNYGQHYVNNMKIWDHVIDDPTWIYVFENTGLDSTALHEVYGEVNEYKPVLTGEGNGVGYYYKPN